MLFKKKVVKVFSGEKINLLSRLTLSGKINDIEDKIENIIEYCSNCNKKNEKTQQNYNFPLNDYINDPKKTPTIMEDSKYFEKNSIIQSFLQSQKPPNPPNPPNPANPSNPSTLTNSSTFQTCSCLKSFQNYKSTKLRLTYLAYVKFPDGTNSLLKTETVWNITNEPSIILNLHIKDSKIDLENSIDLNVIIENNMSEELELSADESSFRFVYSKSDKNFGALILENKLVRAVYVPGMSRDTVVFSFMPVKSGFIELEEIGFWDVKRKREWVFKCGYKILIN